MREKLTIAAIVTAALTLQLLAAGPAVASKAIADNEGAACTACHDKPGSKLMTDRGKYWELLGSFEGYDDLQASFGRCTTCHVREPGSAKLTKTGKKYRSLLQTMDGLREWVMQPHPVAPADEGAEPDADR